MIGLRVTTRSRADVKHGCAPVCQEPSEVLRKQELSCEATAARLWKAAARNDPRVEQAIIYVALYEPTGQIIPGVAG